VTHEPPRRNGRKPALRQSQRPDGEADDSEDTGATTSERPTVNPPFDVEAFARASAASVVPTPSGSSAPASQCPSDTPTARPPSFDSPTTRTQQITLTNEGELERSVSISIQPMDVPRSDAPSALSMANARVPSAPNFPAASPTSAGMEAAARGSAGGSAGPDITQRTIEDPIAEMRERLSLGDYTGAFEMAELLLAEDPYDAEAAECAESCRSVLEGMYAARLGPLDRVPTVIVQSTQLRWLSMDHRAGFVLSLIDGLSTLEMILDVSGMPRLDTMRILQELLQQRIVALKT
jgi:hypothetical protein